MSKAHLLELFQEGFWRRAVVQAGPVAAFGTRCTPAMASIVMPIFERKAAIGPRPELPWQVQPKKEPSMMALVAEVTVLEMRHIVEPEHEIAVAELEHQTALAEVPEMSRPEPWDVSELGRKTTVAEVPEVARLRRPKFSNEAAVVEFEAMMAQVQLRASVP